MKKIGLLLLLLIFGLEIVLAQEAPAFQLKERKGVQLNSKTMALLLDKTWTSYKQYEVVNGQAKLQSGNFFSLRISNDSTFYVSGTRFRQNGAWVAKGKQLQLSIDEEEKSRENISMEGNYQIYLLNADEMILVKEAAGNPVLVCYCKSSMVKALDNSPQVSATTEDKEKSRKESLGKEIEMELFLRGEKVKMDLGKKSNSELNKIRDLIIKGEFSKEEVLRAEIKSELFLRNLAPPSDLDQLSYGKLKKLKKQILANKYKAN